MRLIKEILPSIKAIAFLSRTGNSGKRRIRRRSRTGDADARRAFTRNTHARTRSLRVRDRDDRRFLPRARGPGPEAWGSYLPRAGWTYGHSPRSVSSKITLSVRGDDQ